MARLTWENVANPNFSGVADSYRVMSELLGKAATSGKNALDIFSDAKTSAADKAILQRMLAADTGAEYDPTAIIGSDAANASIAALKDVGDWGGTVLNRDTTRMTNEQTGKNNAYLNEGRDYAKNNAVALNNARRLAAGSPAALEGVPLDSRPDQYGAVVDDVNTLLTSDLNRDSTTQRMKITDYSQDRLVRGDKISDAALVAMDDVNANSIPGDIESAQRYVYSRTDWSPEVRAQVLGRIGSMQSGGGNGAAAAIGGAVGGSTRGNSSVADFKAAMGPSEGGAAGYNAQNDAGYNGMYQFGQARLNDVFAAGVIPKMSMEEFRKNPQAQEAAMDWQIKDIDSFIEKNGLTQYIGKTIGGVPVTQDAMRAMAHLGGNAGMKKFLETNGAYNPNDAYTTKDGKQVKGTSLSDYGKKFAGLTPEEQRLGGFDPARTLTQNLDVADESSNIAIGNLSAQYAKALQGRNFPNEAAQELAKAIPGADVDKLETQINRIIAESWDPDKGRYSVSASEAAAAIRLASAPGKTGWQGLLFGNPNNYNNQSDIADGRIIDQRLLRRVTDSLKDGSVKTDIATDFRLKQAQAAVMQLEAKRDSLQARYQAAAKNLEVRGASATPALRQEVARLLAELQAATRDVALANGAGIAKQASVTPPAGASGSW